MTNVRSLFAHKGGQAWGDWPPTHGRVLGSRPVAETEMQ